MIRCIQIGTTTVQGHVLATYPDPSGEHGAIRSMGRVVIGRLTESKRAEDDCPDCGLPHPTRNPYCFCKPAPEPNEAMKAMRARYVEVQAAKRARYGDEELAEIKAWMAGE